jgi:hypothetical protein
MCGKWIKAAHLSNYMTNTRIVNVGDAIYSAHHKTKFDPKHFLLSYDQTTDLKIRAQFANIGGEDRVFMDAKARINPDPGLGSYCLEVVKEEVAISRFLNPPSRKEKIHSRPGIRGEYISLIAQYPQHVRKYGLVCINSELFLGDMYMSPVIFEWKADHFEARVLPELPRVLYPGNAVIFRK